MALCLHEILLHIKSECSEEIDSSGSHIIKYTLKDLESIYAFTKEHYKDLIPAGDGVTEGMDKLERYGNIVISRRQGFNNRTMAVKFVKDDDDIESSHIPWHLFPLL